MPVDIIRIDETTWGRASATRRREWRSLILDIEGKELWPERSCAKMIVQLGEDALEIRLYDGPAEPVEVTIAREPLESVLDEYLSVIDRLEEDGLTGARAEALDMAKRVVHDDAARKLAKLLPDLARTHECHRRFFSLVVSLAVDTSQKASAHRHL